MTSFMCLAQRNKKLESSWNVMAHGDAREGKWMGYWRMEWVPSTLHTTTEHGVSSITTADAHNSAASSRLNWRPPADLNGLIRFARKIKSGFCACAITFQKQSTKQQAGRSRNRSSISGRNSISTALTPTHRLGTSYEIIRTPSKVDKVVRVGSWPYTSV